MTRPAWLHPDFGLADPAGRTDAGQLAAAANALSRQIPARSRVGLAATDARSIMTALIAAEAATADLFIIRDPSAGAEVAFHIEGATLVPHTAAASGTGQVWLQTSGSTGRPKWVAHAPEALRRTIAGGYRPARWLLSYGAGSFAGLQVLLSAAVGGHALVAPPPSASAAELATLALEHRITHLSGTPTFWRAFLMALGSADLPLAAVTLGGEAADQALLDALRAKFPDARLRHLYATTELGTVFSVADGRAGFPAAWLESGPSAVRLAVSERDTLAVARGDGALQDTGDRVAITGDRVLFRGRHDLMVNVGGVKIWPEEVEAHLLELPFLRDALVSARPSPITGSILVADLVLADAGRQAEQDPLVRAHLARLPRAARPAMIRYKPALPTGGTGKKLRMP
jgi:acyl-coenzyme A synthetase/AMP-(fatty) acid ligase